VDRGLDVADLCKVLEWIVLDDISAAKPTILPVTWVWRELSGLQLDTETVLVHVVIL
jgi:hypothetical protein